jgi:hypothetical protein
MVRIQTFSAVALLLPFLASSLPAQAAKMDLRAARAECFRQANAAANANTGWASASADPAGADERNACGTDAYRACCRKMGIRP